MRKMTLKEFVETTHFNNRVDEFYDIMLTDTTPPSGWINVGGVGYNEDERVDCWATTDHKMIIFIRSRLAVGDNEEDWSIIRVLVAP